MPLTVTTDVPEIIRLADAALESDPVRNTIVSSIVTELHRTGRDGWAAHDGAALATRSAIQRPVTLTAGWAELAPLAAAVGALPELHGLAGPPDLVDALAGLLGRPAAQRTAERLFRLDQLTEPRPAAGQVRLGSAADLDLLTDWFGAFMIEAAHLPSVPDDNRDRVEAALQEGRRPWLWTDASGEPVSLAIRQTTVHGVARIGPVYTPPEHRGRGYASAVTAHATVDILADGATPVLFTDLANPTSNKIYQALGYYAVTDWLAINYR